MSFAGVRLPASGGPAGDAPGHENETAERDLSALELPRWGRLRETGDPGDPYQLIDKDGRVCAEAQAFSKGRGDTTLRSYALDLLRWLRFLWVLDTGGTRRPVSRRGTSCAGCCWPTSPCECLGATSSNCGQQHRRGPASSGQHRGRRARRAGGPAGRRRERPRAHGRTPAAPGQVDQHRGFGRPMFSGAVRDRVCLCDECAVHEVAMAGGLDVDLDSVE